MRWGIWMGEDEMEGVEQDHRCFGWRCSRHSAAGEAISREFVAVTRRLPSADVSVSLVILCVRSRSGRQKKRICRCLARRVHAIWRSLPRPPFPLPPRGAPPGAEMTFRGAPGPIARHPPLRLATFPNCDESARPASFALASGLSPLHLCDDWGFACSARVSVVLCIGPISVGALTAVSPWGR